MISSLLLCMPASGGLARSTLNSQIGSKSQVNLDNLSTRVFFDHIQQSGDPPPNQSPKNSTN